jgi:Ca2+-dependent lipid-binding protein
VAAKNLPSTVKLLQSWRGSLHPFAVVSLGKQTFRTKVARATLDPVWKQSAILYTHAVS